MWLLILTLVAYDPLTDQPRFAQLEQRLATEADCRLQQDWWLDHPDAAPLGFDDGWTLLIGPSCVGPQLVS